MGPVHILTKLEQAGFEAYFVGGCVRDTLLGREVNDWDIATSATPQEVMATFDRTVATGLKHGTVTVLDGNNAYEVTTFRCDGDYLDGRHPESVTFVRNLKEDLSRRDFTVNAMAMDGRGNVTDLFGGREDLVKKVLRCVGDAETRFREDALRMLRALRFSAQLGFSVEEKTASAIGRCAPLCASLSAERVRVEVEKTLLSPRPEAVERMLRGGLLRPFGLEGEQDLSFLADLPCEPAARWAGLFYACPQASWETLRMDKKTGQTASAAASLGAEKRTRTQWKAVLSQYGEEIALCAASLASQRQDVEEILASGEPVFFRDLAVSGRDFAHLEGKTVGRILQKLLDRVHENPADNQKEILLQLADTEKETSL